MSRRVTLFPACSFAITWSLWGVLVALARAHLTVYGQGPFMLLYALGGLGPTIAAYAAVLATRDRLPLREYHGRLFRWRVASVWYVVAVCLPVALALLSLCAVAVTRPAHARAAVCRPALVPVRAALLRDDRGRRPGGAWRAGRRPARVGEAVFSPGRGHPGRPDWSIWHLPLFVLPGVSQYGTDFLAFAVQVVGAALMLAWLNGRTGSTLLCVAFHASGNAAWTLGPGTPEVRVPLAWVDACLGVVVGLVLLSFRAAPADRVSEPDALSRP